MVFVISAAQKGECRRLLLAYHHCELQQKHPELKILSAVSRFWRELMRGVTAKLTRRQKRVSAAVNNKRTAEHHHTKKCSTMTTATTQEQHSYARKPLV